MARRGQIFLIMTILVITFMIGITSILVDIRRTDYLDPSPDLDESISSWETTIDSIEQILDVKLTIATQQGTLSSSIDITNSLDNLIRYLNERGVSATITVTNDAGTQGLVDYSITGNETISSTVRITGLFQIFLKSGSTEISQTVNKTLSYQANAPDANNLYLTKTLDTTSYYITGALFDQNPILDNYDGSYDISVVTGLTTITLSNNLVLYLTLL